MPRDISQILKPPPKTLVGRWIKDLRMWWRSLPWVAARIEKNRLQSYDRIHKQQQRRYHGGGLIVDRHCNCGNYRPKSIAGLIDSDCRNCGGKRPERIYG